MGDRSLATICAVTCVALLGCGDSREDAAKDALDQYLQALVDGDGAKACDLATKDYQEHLLRGLDTPPIANADKLTCEDRVRQTREKYGEAHLNRWTDYRVVKTEDYSKDEFVITIRFTGFSGEEETPPCPLRKEGGGWKVASDCE